MARETLVGTVRRLGLEGGLWALTTEDGRVVELIAPPEALRVAGLRAEVELDRETAEVSVGMVGDAARVVAFRGLPPGR